MAYPPLTAYRSLTRQNETVQHGLATTPQVTEFHSLKLRPRTGSKNAYSPAQTTDIESASGLPWPVVPVSPTSRSIPTDDVLSNDDRIW